uniref:Uncharacterized protein n=1 Tax=Ditylenchus dipsaci TaxID=166011 RepID=A0A915CTC0_9BILA
MAMNGAVEDIFGKQFGQHFGNIFESGSSASKSTEVSPVEPSAETPAKDSSTPAPAEAPKTPNFCTLIV